MRNLVINEICFNLDYNIYYNIILYNNYIH